MAYDLPCLRLIFIVKCLFMNTVGTNYLVQSKVTKHLESLSEHAHLVQKELCFLQFQNLFFILFFIDKLHLRHKGDRKPRHDLTREDVIYLLKILFRNISFIFWNPYLLIMYFFIYGTLYLPIALFGINFSVLSNSVIAHISIVWLFLLLKLLKIIERAATLVRSFK